MIGELIVYHHRYQHSDKRVNSLPGINSDRRVNSLPGINTVIGGLIVYQVSTQ